MALKCKKLKRRLVGFELCGMSADGNGIDYRCREKGGLWGLKRQGNLEKRLSGDFDSSPKRDSDFQLAL